jgi:hypothetical protein
MSTLLNIGILLSATDMFSPALNSATGNLSTFDNKVKNTSADMLKLSTAALAVGEGVTGKLSNFFGDSQDLRAAQGELKTLGLMGDGLKSVTSSAMDFSNQFAGTTAPEFIRASYDIKSGISSLSDVAVGKFTSISAMTALATLSTTSEMTNLFATGFGIYRKQFDEFGLQTIQGWNALSDEEKDIKFGQYFSAGISSAVQVFKTKGSQMSAALSNLGANATSAGISFAEQLSILGQLQKTMTGSEAATKYRAFLNTAYSAGDKLGLTFTNANNELLSMPEILTMLKDKYGNTIDAMESNELKNAFGTDEAVSLIKQLYPETDTLTKNINKMNLSLQEGTKKTRDMANAANEGKEQEVYEQRINNLTAAIGSGFAPVMLTTMDIMGSAAVVLSDFMNEHETLTTAIVSVIGVGGGLLTVIGSLGVIASGASFVMPFLSGGLGIVSTSFGVATAATRGFTAALISNPVVAIATGVAMAAYLIYENWDGIVGFFSDIWTSIKEEAAPVLEFIENGINTVSELFGFGDDKQIAVTTNGNQGAVKVQQEVMGQAVSSDNQAIYNNKKESVTKVYKSEDTFHVTVANPSSNVDVVEAMEDYKKRQRNRSFED